MEAREWKDLVRRDREELELASERDTIRGVQIRAGAVYNWRASEASETLSGVYKFELVRYVYIYICMEVRMSK